MTANITTTGDGGAVLVDTEYESPESIRSWVDRHNQALTASVLSGQQIAKTCYPVEDQEPPECVTTDRIAGEDDAIFRARHVAAYTQRMRMKEPYPG